MFANCLKIALRNIRKYKGYTFINITGLAVSLACCMLISLWILNELSYDKHYADVDRIQAVLVDGNFHGPNPLASYIREHVPEVESAAQIMTRSEMLVTSDKQYGFEDVLIADADVIDVFSFPFVAGDAKTALVEPNSVVLTQSAAERFFPDQNPIGGMLILENGEDFMVTGVIADNPHNASFTFSVMIPVEYQRRQFQGSGVDFDSWNFWGSQTCVKTIPGVSASELTNKIAGLIRDRYDDEEVSLAAINIGDVYLRYSETMKGIKLFAGIALAILLMACINFINLSTARYKMRTKEIGIRKVVGAQRSRLILQFLGESALLMLIGFLLALCLVDLTLSLFNSLFHLHLSLGLFDSLTVVVMTLGIIGVTTLATGIYPALLLSKFHPIQALKGQSRCAGKHYHFRRTLVVFQFTLTAILVIGTVVIFMQTRHIKSLEVGYTKEQVVNINLRGESSDLYRTMKTALLQNPDVIAVTGAMKCLPYWHMTTSAHWAGMEPDAQESVNMNFVDYDFAKTYGIAFLEGRDFDERFGADEQTACLINETLAQMMNSSPAVGSIINVWDVDRTVVGVMKDFNFQPLHSPIGPLAIMMYTPGDHVMVKMHYMSVRISPNDISGTIGFIEDTWKRILPNYPFEYSFLDEQFDESYRSLEQIGSLAACFGFLAIVIAGLGLFGLASFTTEQRTKEIGIRKVLGASVTAIVRMIFKEYFLLVLVSNLVAWPLVWIIMDHWLKDFAYRVDMGIGVFIGVGAAMLIIALLSVGYQAVRVACTNPADAMAYE